MHWLCKKQDRDSGRVHTTWTESNIIEIGLNTTLSLINDTESRTDIAGSYDVNSGKF